jgi:lipoate-protein ligase A
LTSALPWRLQRHTGDPADLHAASADLVATDHPERTARLLEAGSAAVVLGRAQALDDVDVARARRAGVAIIRRCSGGGAVLLVPGGAVWVDVVVPRRDPRWDDDIGRAGWWLGEAWTAALASTGLGGGVVHRGGLVRGPWSQRVCFAGLGPGEVTVEGRKVVGMSQRRTKTAALFQCAVLVSWDPVPLLDVLALREGERQQAAGDLRAVARGVGQSRAGRLAAALFDHLD